MYKPSLKFYADCCAIAVGFYVLTWVELLQYFLWFDEQAVLKLASSTFLGYKRVDVLTSLEAYCSFCYR